MKRILTFLIVLLISQMACLQTSAGIDETIEPTSAPTETASPKPTATPGENPAGAVYEIPTIGPAQLCAVVTADEALHLREEPNEKAEHVAYMTAGETVTVESPAGRWWKVTTSDGETGYANSRYLEAEKCS